MRPQNAFQQLLHDPIALLSSGFILICAFIAFFASSIAPDHSPNANQMHLGIHSKSPGFSCQILFMPETEKAISEEIALGHYFWKSDTLFYQSLSRPKGFLDYQTQSDFGTQQATSVLTKTYIQKRTFWWGTDKFGRDLMSRMFYGARVSLSIGWVAVMISLFMGLLLGGIAGYWGGNLDRIIQWLINVTWSIPSLLMVIAITLALGKGFWQVFVAVGLTMWVDVARLVRGQVMAIKEEDYVQAARVLGYSNWRILARHIFPMLIPSLIVISTANFASAILIESGLSFLGIGVQPPMASWGGMIKDHFPYMLLDKAYMALIPGLAIVLIVLAFMLLGNRLRDALDVKK